MTGEDAMLLAMAPISSVIFSLYVYRVYSFKTPSKSKIERARFGRFGYYILSKIKSLSVIGPILLSIGFLLSALYSIYDIQIYYFNGIAFSISGFLMIWLCVSWDILTK